MMIVDLITKAKLTMNDLMTTKNMGSIRDARVYHRVLMTR